MLVQRLKLDLDRGVGHANDIRALQQRHCHCHSIATDTQQGGRSGILSRVIVLRRASIAIIG